MSNKCVAGKNDEPYLFDFVGNFPFIFLIECLPQILYSNNETKSILSQTLHGWCIVVEMSTILIEINNKYYIKQAYGKISIKVFVLRFKVTIIHILNDILLKLHGEYQPNSIWTIHSFIKFQIYLNDSGPFIYILP